MPINPVNDYLFQLKEIEREKQQLQVYITSLESYRLAERNYTTQLEKRIRQLEERTQNATTGELGTQDCQIS